MPLTFEVQEPVVAGQPFSIRFAGKPGERGLLSLFVDDVPRAFHFFSAQPPSPTQPVFLFGAERTSSVLEDWGTQADRGHVLGVQLDQQPVQRRNIR